MTPDDLDKRFDYHAPDAATENVADCPTATVRFAGCDVIVGGAFAYVIFATTPPPRAR